MHPPSKKLILGSRYPSHSHVGIIFFIFYFLGT